MDLNVILDILYYILAFGLLGVASILFLMAIAVFKCPEHIWDNSNDPTEILKASRNKRLEKKRYKR